jgi:hypothetical protein
MVYDMLEGSLSLAQQFYRIPSHLFYYITNRWGTRSSVFCWGTMLQAGRSRVRFLMRSLDFFNWSNHSNRTVSLGSTLPLAEMSTGNLPGSKRPPARKPDNLTAICEPIVRNCGSLDISKPYGSSRPVTGIALPFLNHKSLDLPKICIEPKTCDSSSSVSCDWNTSRSLTYLMSSAYVNLKKCVCFPVKNLLLLSNFCPKL